MTNPFPNDGPPTAKFPFGDPRDPITHVPFGTYGRFNETPLPEMSQEMREAYDFTLSLRGTVPGPHKIWLANPTCSTTIVPTGEYFQKHSSLTKAEIEITTNTINSVWRASYGNFEHEWIGEEQGGLDPIATQHIIAGLPTSFDDARQQVVYELATTLANQRLVPAGMFLRAQELIGDKGIVDVCVLMGWFSMVGFTLNAYDVPAGAPGITQPGTVAPQ